MNSNDPRTTVVGVLGGIASGKSRVAHELAGPDGVVLDADRLAREVLDSPEVRARIEAELGPGIVVAGRVDRAALAELVFRDPAARTRLEGWIHPRVRAMLRDGVAEARASGRRRIVLDVPLLLENDAEHGLAGMCDTLVFVDSDLATRDRRAVAHRGWQPGEVERREAAQLPLSEKRARADHVIDNRGTESELVLATRELSDRLEALS